MELEEGNVSRVVHWVMQGFDLADLRVSPVEKKGNEKTCRPIRRILD